MKLNLVPLLLKRLKPRSFCATVNNASRADEETLDLYRGYVSSCAHAWKDESKISDVIMNSGAEHAAVVIANIMNVAQDRVDLLTGCLRASVYSSDEVMKPTLDFLRRGGSMRIIVDETRVDHEFMTKHPFLARIHQEGFGDQLDVVGVPYSVSQKYGYHMMIADGSCYRYERDKTGAAATAQFGDQAKAAERQELFDAIWDQRAESAGAQLQP